MTTDVAASLDHLRLLGALQDEFLATIPQVDPTARVPWCGRWRVRDLVVHLARIHHWAAGQASRRRETPLGRGPFDLVDLYATCAAELRDTLLELGPDAPASTLVGPGPASFWHRRQLHETLVHLWDLRTAGGLPLDVDAAVWADTVDEVVTVMQPRQEALGRMEPLPAPVALVATDATPPRTWSLGGDRSPAVTVHASAQDLALLVWGRRSPDDDGFRVDGDRAALGDALARRLTP
ncbi:maleylpyruvate isomerase family mycothiol-dependent enzyme [Cellulomonas fimi]|uniref:maleylpyruvate isomerase family mycothiol-dependent enzyme n=1 Tax=Cellulomonas fimi TaxID=1708 RepID=UPI00234DA4B2|nr:maleylpyruvate isomerase family mycothiol-dependent enzyme [Cellulomonas fimi]MDC7121044.1 maleylpyruvate isomerase family mycothiol-dependent enzyme [Cellulomonas fimi]